MRRLAFSQDKVLASHTWFGYGSWSAPFWFIGKEPGASQDDAENYASWVRLGAIDLVDCREHDLEYRGTDRGKWHTGTKPLQPTWRPLIAALLAYKGSMTYDVEAIRRYQTESWGRTTGETAVLELSAVAAPDAKSPEALRLADVDARIETIREKIRDHTPTFVWFYGTGSDTVKGVPYSDYWQRIAGDSLTENEPRRIGNTVYVFTKHPTAHGLSNDFWVNLGRRLRQFAGHSSEHVPSLDGSEKLVQVPARSLTAADVSRIETDWSPRTDKAGTEDRSLIDFALSFDGYEFLGNDLGQLCNVVKQIYERQPRILDAFSIAGLRALLFFEQRRARWHVDNHVDDFTNALVRLIRERVKE
jgi:hypothetical protein